jgi:hypothetical protein
MTSVRGGGGTIPSGVSILFWGLFTGGFYPSPRPPSPGEGPYRERAQKSAQSACPARHVVLRCDPTFDSESALLK